MNKVILTVAITCIVGIITGCSHNSIQYSDGVGLETTFRPDSGNFGLTFRYGKILSAVLRENSEIEMSGKGSGSGSSTGTTSSTGTASADGSLKVKIGKQITGYYVDALNAGATADNLEKYTSEDQAAK